MTKMMILGLAAVLALPLATTSATAKSMNCFISKTGSLSKFGMFCGDGKGGSSFIEYRRTQPGAMFEIKDSSLRKPLGGRNSVPNKILRGIRFPKF
jgi:hypothetical protein